MIIYCDTVSELTYPIDKKIIATEPYLLHIVVMYSEIVFISDMYVNKTYNFDIPLLRRYNPCFRMSFFF